MTKIENSDIVSVLDMSADYSLDSLEILNKQSMNDLSMETLEELELVALELSDRIRIARALYDGNVALTSRHRSLLNEARESAMELKEASDEHCDRAMNAEQIARNAEYFANF